MIFPSKLSFFFSFVFLGAGGVGGVGGIEEVGGGVGLDKSFRDGWGIGRDVGWDTGGTNGF